MHDHNDMPEWQAQQNEQDLTYIDRMCQVGILQEINSDLHPKSVQTGTQSLCCSDSDQASDILREHDGAFGHRDKRYGWINAYGGALLIAPFSPLSRHHMSPILAQETYLGHLMGKGETILYNHAPCGRVRLKRLSVRESCKLFSGGKEYLQEFFRQRSANTVKYMDAQRVLARRYGRPATPEQIMVYAEIDFEEINAIEETAALMDLREAAHKEPPTFLMVFQVDYEKLGRKGVGKKLFRFDRHGWGNEEQAQMGREEHPVFWQAAD